MPVSGEQRERFADRLVQCVQGGNELAFEELVRTLVPVIGYEVRRVYYVPGADRE